VISLFLIKTLENTNMNKRMATPRTAAVLHALANERRLAVVELVAQGERSVGELERLVGISQSALSQHLARLRQAGLVRTRREGRTVYYALESVEAAEIIDTLGGLFRLSGKPRGGSSPAAGRR
jgi:DNA-binding transcriptional ArsR family regulator